MFFLFSWGRGLCNCCLLPSIVGCEREKLWPVGGCGRLCCWSTRGCGCVSVCVFQFVFQYVCVPVCVPVCVGCLFSSVCVCVFQCVWGVCVPACVCVWCVCVPVCVCLLYLGFKFFFLSTRSGQPDPIMIHPIRSDRVDTNAPNRVLFTTRSDPNPIFFGSGRVFCPPLPPIKVTNSSSEMDKGV